jgi:hypothetical protein
VHFELADVVQDAVDFGVQFFAQGVRADGELLVSSGMRLAYGDGKERDGKRG